MRRVIRILSSASLALICASSTPGVFADETKQVLAQDLNKSRSPGRVAAVLWTARVDYCTLQVVFPNAGRIAQATQENPRLKSQSPRHVQVWLLRADGSIIPPLWRSSEPGDSKPANMRVGLPDVTFRFPSTANGEAVAAVIGIDDEFQVERLKILGDGKG